MEKTSNDSGLRPELMPPRLNESVVTRLTELAEALDGGHREEMLDQLAEFNKTARTTVEFIEFQGIYCSQDHDVWVRRILNSHHVRRIPEITRLELIELARRVMECDGDEASVDFWLSLLKANIPNERISDLIYWPDSYFGDRPYSPDMTPAQVIDIALKDGNPGK